MLVIYTEIFYMIHKQLNKKACTISHTDPNKYYDKELKLAKSLALVLFLFAISWLPLHIINCITLFCPTCDKPLFLIYIAILLTHGNSAVNPIVYAFRIKKFRDAFLKIWKQYFCCKDVPAILNQPSEKDRKEKENQNGNGNPNPIGDSPPAPSPSQEGQQLPLEQMVKQQLPQSHDDADPRQKPPMEHNNI
nr:adenosine receptor A1-like [Salvelinus alpinus]